MIKTLSYRYIDGSQVMGHAMVELVDGRQYDCWELGLLGSGQWQVRQDDTVTGSRLNCHVCDPQAGTCECGQADCIHLNLVRQLQSEGKL